MREKLFWSRHDANHEFENHMEDVVYSGELVLDVGCGTYKVHPSLMGVDAHSDSNNVNVQAYMWDMPFGDSTIDGLFCMMALEHISKFQIMPTLTEFNRVLKVGAKFIILVPNLVWVMQEFVNNPSVNWQMDMLFGTQLDDGEYHKTGFTEDILKLYFAEVIPNCSYKIYNVIAYNQMCYGVVMVKEKG